MFSVEWVHSRPYYLNSNTTPFHYLWGSLWFLFDPAEFERFGSETLNLGVRLAIHVEAEICESDEALPAAPVFGDAEVWLYNRFKIDHRGNVQNPHPSQETYRYSTDDNRIGIPFQLFNINTLQVFTQLSPLPRRNRDQLMHRAPPTSGRLDVQFEYKLQSDLLGPNFIQPAAFALPNRCLVQEIRHPGRFVFAEPPAAFRAPDSFEEGGFDIEAKWDGNGGKTEVEWNTNANLAVGPNRYNRMGEFPGEKYFA